MNTNHYPPRFLEEVRTKNGLGGCKEFFRELLSGNPNHAAELLQDHTLSFPVLFVILPQAGAGGLIPYLSNHQLMVLKIIDRILNRQQSKGAANFLLIKDNTVYQTLKWMVETGHSEDGFSNEYDEVMDMAVLVLLHTYGEKSILPLVSQMIFNRNRKDLYLHDLVWAYFKIRDPDALRLIAEGIRSNDDRDYDLACNLLGIEASNQPDSDRNREYNAYLVWLEENDPFLYFTGEAFGYASKPSFCKVDLERKYIHKGFAGYEKQPPVSLNPYENRHLAAFKPLSEEEKERLSDYSYQLHNNNYNGWERWMKAPLKDQLKQANVRPEGFR